jgi:hypothetical protein
VVGETDERGHAPAGDDDEEAAKDTGREVAGVCATAEEGEVEESAACSLASVWSAVAVVVVVVADVGGGMCVEVSWKDCDITIEVGECELR